MTQNAMEILEQRGYIDWCSNRDGLAALSPDMPLDQSAAAMAEALAAAQLAGRYEVLQEAAGNG